METTLMIIDAITAKLTIPLTFGLVIIYVLRKLGKGKDKNSFLNRLNRALRKTHIPMGISLAIVSLIHGIASQTPVLWGIVCCITIFLLGFNYMLRKKIKKPNWMKVHRILTVVMLVTLVLHLGEIKTIKEERYGDKKFVPKYELESNIDTRTEFE